MKKLTFKLMGLFALTALILPGCKSNGSSAAADVEKNVSADAMVIMSLNVNEVIENAGGTAKGGKYALGQTLAQLIDDEDFEEEFEAIMPMVDASNFLLSVNGPASLFWTCPLLDAKGMEKKITDDFGFSKREVEGFKVFFRGSYDNEGVFMMRDGQLWFATTADVVIDDIKSAETNSVASHKEFMDVLKGHTFGFIGDLENLGDMIAAYGGNNPFMACTGAYSAGYADLSGLKASAHFEMWDENYKVVKSAGDDAFGTISDKELRVLPEACKLAFAIGKPSPEILQSILAQAGIGTQEAAIASQGLNGINGSIVIGADIPDNLMAATNPAAWDFTVAVGYDEESANGLLSLAQMFGAQRSGDGYVFPINKGYMSVNIHFGYYDGQLVVSTNEISVNGTPAIAKKFDGQKAAFAVSVPAGNGILEQLGIEWGIDMSAYGSTTAGDAFVEMTGAKGYLLENIIKVANR